MVVDVDLLKSHLNDELINPGTAVTEIRNIFLEFKSEENEETAISLLSGNEEIIELLMQNCDRNINISKSLYPFLYSWVQYNTERSLRLVSHFIPTLVWQYLSNVGSEECEQSETCLLHLANTLSDKTGFSFRLPSIHMISIYHQPAKLQYSGGLTEASLSKGFNMEPVYRDPPPVNYGSITSTNMLTVLTLLLQKYNQNIGNMVSLSLERFCWLCIWICGSGMSSSSIPATDMKCWTFSKTRFTLNKDIMTTLVSGLQYCLYNGHSIVAKKALDTCASRAEYDVCPEVMMMTAALQDTVRISAVTPAYKPFGIPIPQLSGTQNDTRPVRRSIIRQDDIQQLRKRISSNEIREESENEGPSPASVIIDCTDSDESDIHIAGFRGGKLAN